MTTRHVSAQNDYPFYMVPDALRPLAQGILDVYFVIQGPESGFMTGTSSSSSEEAEEPPELLEQVRLVQYDNLGTTTRFTFWAISGNRYWVITFTVPHTGGDIGQVSNDDVSDCRAVLIYNADFITLASGTDILQVEPGRAQFHVEQVNTLEFYNIWRCNGVETPESSNEVLKLGASSSGPMELALVNGYNTVVSYESSLEIAGGTGLGLGIVPDIGNTAPGCSSSGEEDLELEDVVTTINGILPEAGNIPLQVSRSVGKQRSPGRLELLIRNQ
jgi:hypothetical protein